MMPNMVEIEQTYAAEILPGLPGVGPPPYQFSRSGRVHSEGLVVMVRLSDNGQWVGNLQRGVGQFSGIWGLAGAAVLLVVASGQGYWLDVHRPEVYDAVSMAPITDVRSIPELGLLILAGLTDIAAYSAGGRVWASGSVSWDGLRIVEATANGISGIGWDAPAEREVGFFLNPRTGSREGGSGSPP